MVLLVTLVFAASAPMITQPLTAAADFHRTVMHEKEDVFRGSFSQQSVNISAGQVFEVSFSIVPVMDVPNTVIRFIMPGNLVRLVQGDGVWMGDVKKGETVTLAFSIVADEEVDACVSARVEGYSSGRSYSSSYAFRVTTPMKSVDSEFSGGQLARARQLSLPTSSEESPESLEPASPGTITIKGRLMYINEDGGYSPMRRVKVYLMDDDWGPDEEVASQWTGYDGRFSFTVNNNDGVGQDGRDPYVKAEAENPRAVCRPGYLKYYYAQLPKAGDDVPDGFYYDYGTRHLISKYEAWQAIDAVLSEADWIWNRVSWKRPQLNIYWPSGDWPEFVYWIGLVEHINLPDKTIWNWNHATVHHEYGHAVMYELYGNSMPPMPVKPDPHYVWSVSCGGFALSEGWAEFMQCAVDNDPDNLQGWHNFHGGNIETNDWYNCIDTGDMDGGIVEGSVASILWDILDPKGTADEDDMYLGFDRIFTVMRYDQPDNIDQFWTSWKARWSALWWSVGPLCTIYWHYGIDKDVYSPFGVTPAMLINAGATYTTTRSVTLTLNAKDYGSGVRYMRFSDVFPCVWSGWYTYSTSKSWTLTSGDGTKSVYVQFKDGKGYTSGIYVDTVILDTVKPTGSIVINWGNPTYTTSTSVTLYVTYSDATSGVDKVRYKNSGGSWTAWMTPLATKAWALLTGDGTKTVYYQIRDNAGWLSPIYSDTIILDTMLPTAYIHHEPGSSTITLTADDGDGSGVDAVYYRIDVGEWNLYTEPIQLTGTGSHTVDTASLDKAGNGGVGPSLTVHSLTIDVSPPGGGSTNPTTGTYWHDSDTSITVTQTPANGYAFNHWDLDGSDVGTDSSYTATMDSPHTLTAEFRAVKWFDFGTETSAVEAGHIQIAPSTLYSASVAYGWDSSSGLGSRDRGSPDDLRRDFVFSSVDRTFKVDLPNGDYLITVIVGDQSYSHDDINIYAEDILKASISANVGEFIQEVFVVAVDDGQLNLLFHDDGGSDPNWVVNALLIDQFTVKKFDFGTEGSPVESGYVRATPSTTYSPSLGYGWTTTGDLWSRDRLSPDNIRRDFVFSSMNKTFQVDLPSGTYLVMVIVGDQSFMHDNICVYAEDALKATVSTGAGEFVQRVFVVSVADGSLDLMFRDDGGGDSNWVINAILIQTYYERKFDFGTDTSPVEPGYTQVLTSTSYSELTGYGWADTADLYARDRGAPDSLRRDFVFSSSSRTFKLDLPDGRYMVVITVGDNSYGHDRIDIYCEGMLVVNDLTVETGYFAEVTFIAEVWDGQLEILFCNDGGTDPNWVVNSIHVKTTFDLRLELDFGSSSSPVENGCVRVTSTTAYSPSTSYGWSDTANLWARDRGAPDELRGDFVFSSRDRTFNVQLPNGQYQVTLIIGDQNYMHDRIDIYAEGVLVANDLTASAGTFIEVTFTVTVSDGQLNMAVHDDGGADANWIINSMTIESYLE